MFETLPTTGLSVTTVADIVRLALAPVFLLSGIGAFLNVCASRLSRIVERSRQIEPLLIASRGSEHDRWIGELKILDRRMNLVSWATVVALFFIAAMLTIAAGFSIFLWETQLGARAVRVRSELLQHQVDEGD